MSARPAIIAGNAGNAGDGAPAGIRADLEAYVRARVPILYLVTWEEERVLRELEAAAAALKKPLHTWTETQGLRTAGDADGHGEDRRLKEPAAVLGRVLRDERPGLYALVDFHPYVDQPLVRRQLRDLAHTLVTSGKTLVIVAPRLVLPYELQKEVTVVEVPLPSHVELDGHLDAIAGHLRASGGEVLLDRRERDELIRSAQMPRGDGQEEGGEEPGPPARDLAREEIGE